MLGFSNADMGKFILFFFVICLTFPQLFGVEKNSVRKNSYTPQRQAGNEARRAYEPFKELEMKRAEEERQAKWKFAPDRVVIHLVTEKQLEVRIAKGAQAPVPLEEVAGIKSINPLFPIKAMPSMAAWRAKHPILDRWMLAEVEKGTNIKALVATLNNNSLVDVAEPDYLLQLADGAPEDAANSNTTNGNENGLSSVPESNDANPNMDKQWHLESAKIKEAWQYLEDQGLPAGGSSDIVVAVIDSGVDYTHPDLAPNMWVNGAEIPNNGIDDDGNGIVDDIHGADFLSNSSNHNGNPTDHNGHGTHVAGIIAAVADNNLGGVGVAYNSRVMAIKAAQYNGSLTNSDVAESIYYAVENGADIINMSFGGSAPSVLQRDALEVAFSQAVLVAAAGNDGKHTELPPKNPVSFYPAAWPFVVGVMAENSVPSSKGEYLAGFSNWDSKPSSQIEYEMMAPGTAIYSTLPGENYAAWNGTSMAAPVVAGVAALVRTKFSNKTSYSSRFIAGQVTSTGINKLGKTPLGLLPMSYFSLNGSAALSSVPKPELTVVDYQIFDDPSFSDINDGDGIVDSGETIELAVTIKNRWGKADPVTVTLSAQAEGAIGPDPYVTWDLDKVEYGAIGNFGEDDNGLIRDAEGLVTGVQNPFRFTVSNQAPNNHIIPIKINIESGNGFDAEDQNAPYKYESDFSLVVQRGRLMPSFIENDLVMTKEHYWIVDRSTYIPKGVTVTIEDGVQIQFWDKATVNALPQAAITVEGNLSIKGSLINPVELFPSESLPGQAVVIKDNGDVQMEYFKILNPYIQCDSASHGFVTQDNFLYSGINTEWDRTRGIGKRDRAPALDSKICKKISFYRLGATDRNWYWEFDENIGLDGALVLSNGADTCLINESQIHISPKGNEASFINNSFVRPIAVSKSGYVGPSGFYTKYIWDGNLSWVNNAILMNPWQSEGKYNFRFYLREHNNDYNFSNTFWGNVSLDLINNAIEDRNDNFTYGEVIVKPVLTNAPESCWPFVKDCVFSTELENDVISVGAEEVTFTITFNRDMNTSIQPRVSFGPDDPATDFTVLGDWKDSKTWIGNFKFSSITGDGYQLIRIEDAVAADDAWLVTGKDIGRFRFQIATSGTEALTLQASGGEGFVDLSWGQDDYELLAGYNIYRQGQRINNTIIPVGTTNFRDTNVEPGESYDYYFKVVLTDMSESESSNTSTGTPIDTIPPVISHSAISSAKPNLSLTIASDITDNVSVSGATLFYRLAGSDANYSTRQMVNATNNRWTATLEGSLLQAPGLEYYLSATDGVSTTYSGRAETPYLVTVDDRPVVTGLTPNRGPASGGTVIQLTGTNFKENSTVAFGSTLATQVSFVSTTQLEVTTPNNIPKTVTVSVTNPGDRVGRLLNGYTFFDDLANIYLSDVAAESGEFVTIPLGVANVTGLASLGATIKYDPNELSFSKLTKGGFLQDWVLVSNTTIDGEVRLAAASNGVALSGSGDLASIEFRVLGQPGGSAALSLSDVSLNGGAIIPSETIGSVTVEEFVTIGGKIYFQGDTSKPMKGVKINLEGAGTRSANTGDDGQFLLRRLPFSDYKLTYNKDDEISEISAFDAALVLRHQVGLETLTGYSLDAADVNRDGQVLPMDAYDILRHSAGLEDISVPAGGTAWVFDPPSRTYSELRENITNQNANAFLLGDVSGNWNKATQQNGEAVDMDIYSVSDYQNDKTLARVLLDTGAKPLFGAELTLNYDPELSLRSVKCPDSAFVFNTSVAGQIQISLANASGVIGDKVLVEVEFNESVAEPTLSLSSVNLNEGSLLAVGTPDNRYFDRDNDGLLDSDELGYFKTDPDLKDSDGDGWDDGDEIRLGYIPTKSQSIPAIEPRFSTVRRPNGGLRALKVTFATRSSRIYHIEQSKDLINWSILENEIIGAGKMITRQLLLPDDKMFIRVREEK
ncbi:S8 family serine peptidase [Verrucomicrobiales bacterium]|nr:S8 family serine peptidase [Verrucomicrobiales bacterium]